MPHPEIPDTSVLISIIRDQSGWSEFQRRLASGAIWLSTVVMAELYVGTRSVDESRILDRVAASMDARDRLLTPTSADWLQAGRLIGRGIRLYGAMRPRDHLADVLIIVSAARLHGTVVTANLRHFERWAQLASNAGLDVTVTPFRA